MEKDHTMHTIHSKSDSLGISLIRQGVSGDDRRPAAEKLRDYYFTLGFNLVQVREFLLSWNLLNSPPLPPDEIDLVLAEAIETEGIKDTGWPKPLAGEAFYGLAGETVRLIEPHTEADPVALLSQFLTAYANVIGRQAYFQVEADRHYLKLFPVLVGETSKSRKGTAWGHAKKPFETIDPHWVKDRITSGLSSGEGLIWQVRDAIPNTKPFDPGEADKRLVVIEPEFASTFRVMGRNGNTLSPIIRQAWDDGNLNSLTKNCQAKATGAHISIIGHITKDELRRYLDRTEAGNGFGNRFIWLSVKRSKVLPEGGKIREVNFESIVKRIKETVEFAQGVEEIKRDEEARGIWFEMYEELSEGKPGLWGAVTSRAEAQVMRIACIYALLDKSTLIKKEHLLAALALWDYSEQSARYIFGDALGDPVADQIMQALRNSHNGLTRTEIRDLFGRHKDKDLINSALSLLQKYSMARMILEKTEGRSIERWVII